MPKLDQPHAEALTGPSHPGGAPTSFLAFGVFRLVWQAGSAACLSLTLAGLLAKSRRGTCRRLSTRSKHSLTRISCSAFFNFS